MFSFSLAEFFIKNWKSISIGVGVLFVFFAGWHVHGWVYAVDKAKELEQMQTEHMKEEKIANDKSAQLEIDLANERTKTIELNQQLEDSIAKNPASYSCKLPADAILLINKAIPTGDNSSKSNR